MGIIPTLRTPIIPSWEKRRDVSLVWDFVKDFPCMFTMSGNLSTFVDIILGLSSLSTTFIAPVYIYWWG
jgi:hypothetical protein